MPDALENKMNLVTRKPVFGVCNPTEPVSHGQYLFAYIQIYWRVQICPCERIYSCMQNLLHMQTFYFYT